MNNLVKKNIRLLIFALILLIHLSFINNGFVWLDHGDIEEKRAILSLAGLHNAFVSRYAETGYYRPLVTIIHSLNNAVYQNWAPGYHLTNVFLHLAVSFVAGIFLLKFFSFTPTERNLAIFIVGMHVVSWFVVGTISNLQELLVTLFTMLTIYFYAQARTKSETRNIMLTFLCTILALFAKETAVVWIPTLTVVWEKTYSKIKSFPSALLIIGEIIIFGVYILLRLLFVPEIWKTQFLHLPLTEAIGTRILALAMLLMKLFNPFKPSASDAVSIVALPHPMVVTTMGVILLAGFIIYKRGIHAPVSIAILLLGISLAPALNLVPLPRFGSTHYGYLATVSLSALVIIGLRALTKVKRVRLLSYIVLGVWVLTMGISKFAAGFQFKNDLTLFAPEVKTDPNFREGHFYLGNYFYYSGDIRQAKAEYALALTQSPKVIAYVDNRAVLINFAGVLVAENQLDEADKLLVEAAVGASEKLTSSIRYNRALIATKQGDYTKVVDLLGMQVSNSEKIETRYLLVSALHLLGRNSEARDVLTEMLPLVNGEDKLKVKVMLESL